MTRSVLVGLSGGIDSSMTAFLLKERGYKVTGVHFQLLKEIKTDYRKQLDYIAEKIGINWIDYDASELFRQEVIGYFIRFHMEGLTPSPCAHCNPAVKWKLLADIADSLAIDKIASGHYIRIQPENNLFRIYRGIDKPKDQSYYMWQMGQDVLSRAITPLGDFTKEDIRNLADKIGLEVLSEKKESSGLCFSEGKSCEELLNHYILSVHEKVKPGIITDRAGKQIGTHKGYIYYTVGQKKNLNLQVNEKLCVAEIDAEHNVLIADTWQNLYRQEFFIHDFVFADLQEIRLKQIQVMIRGFGLNPTGNATLEIISKNTIKVILETPAWAIAPGQPAVFFSNDKLLGGGIIR